MPPVRNYLVAKPVKTERTHEENQERAYIAASRRSDRSLEARIESARRASEIHKKRTGRALRVTEQDVINEEMYEEEDDDLPAQYRRLTAHLRTGSQDFNHRLQAYLTTTMATRAALINQCMVPNPLDPQYPIPPQFSPQSFMMPQTPTPSVVHSPAYHPSQSYRQAPYPTAGQGYRASHQRSASIPPQEFFHFTPSHVQGAPTADTSKVEEQRRMSLPAQPIPSPQLQTTPRNQSVISRSPTLSAAPTGANSPVQAFTQEATPNANLPQQYGMNQDGGQNAQPLTPVYPGSPVGIAQGVDPAVQQAVYSPFSAALPPESQMFLGPVLDPNNPYTPVYMSGSQEWMRSQSFYSYNPNGSSKSKFTQTPSAGMSQTLAPPASGLSINIDGLPPATPPSGTAAGISTPFTPNAPSYFETDPTFNDILKPGLLSNENSFTGTSGNTPVDWSELVDTSVFTHDGAQFAENIT